MKIKNLDRKYPSFETTMNLLYSHAKYRKNIFLQKGINLDHLFNQVISKFGSSDAKLNITPVEKNMASIFNEVNIHDKKGQELFVLPFEQEVYQYVNKDEYNAKSKVSYEKSMDGFISELKKLLDDDRNFYDRFYAIIKHFGRFLPINDGGKNPTTSIYDQFKLKSAIHNCGDHDLAIIEYDLSGMQDFIYRVTEGENTKKLIAKSLRGRSFYLSLINDG